MKLNPNLTQHHISNKKVTQGERTTEFSASKVLSKVSPGDRRPTDYRLETTKIKK